MKINIGFKYLKKTESVVGKEEQLFEVVGIRYGDSEGLKSCDWKSKEGILNDLDIYVQIISHPIKGQPWKSLGIDWIKLEKLESCILKDLKLLPEYRKYIIKQ